MCLWGIYFKKDSSFKLRLFKNWSLLKKKIDSITKLGKAMDHLLINVSLTYLRGLEVSELTEEDMPMV